MKYNSRQVDPLHLNHGYAGQAQFMGEDIIDITNNRWQNVDGTGDLLDLGTVVQYSNGQKFVYVQMTGGAAALGTVLEHAAVVGEDTVASASDLLSITGGGADTTWVAGAFVGDWVYVDDGTGEGQCRRIVGNTTTVLYLDRPLVTALAVADSDITIIRPFHVIAATAAITTPVCGVSLGVITQNYYGWMQVAGFCEHVLIDDATSTAGTYLVVDDAAAGKAKAVTNANVSLQRIFGIAHATNVSTLVPATLFCTAGV